MSYPRETYEFQPVEVLVDGASVTAGVRLSIVKSGARPGAWVSPASLEGKIGFFVGGYGPGEWDVWAQGHPLDSPEIPVVYCGSIRIT